MSASAPPSLRVERRLLKEGATALACVDEAGRGALCGPATVGVVVVTAATKAAPQGIRDSKLLTPQARRLLVPLIHDWAAAYAVGHASPSEIDELGIVPALRLAGHRALAQLSVPPDAVLLDGSHDYLTPPEQPSLFDDPGQAHNVPSVVTMVKADLRCAAVAAASILAKTARDAILIELSAEYPEYGWHENKGYGARDHLEAIARLGPTPHHRVSWRLPDRIVEGSPAGA